VEEAARRKPTSGARTIVLAVSSVALCQLLIRARMRALPATLMSIVVWLAAALGLWSLAVGQA
jgi:hypothetical protein